MPNTPRKPIIPDQPFYGSPGAFALRSTWRVPGNHVYGRKLAGKHAPKRGDVSAYRPRRPRFPFGL